MDQPVIRVRINVDHAPAGMASLLPGGALRWGNCRFDINPAEGGEADFAIVLWNARPHDRFHCAPENTLFIAGEPLEKKLYPKAFYRQFGHLVDSHAGSAHPHLQVSALGLNWHVGLDHRANAYRYGYDHLAALQPPPKENRIAVVCSNASKTEGQRKRLALLAALKERLGDRLVHFGRGFEPIDDKMDAILPYRYHLVLENCVQDNYWTEKLADAYLGWAFPVYLGCPNVDSYFAPDSFVSINGMDAGEVGELIESLLQVPASGEQLEALRTARDRVLNRYNPFAWVAHWAESLYRPGLPARQLVIRSHRAFRPFPRGHLFRIRAHLAARPG